MPTRRRLLYQFPIKYLTREPSLLNFNSHSQAFKRASYVISPEGKVVKFWQGAYDKATLGDIEEFFQVKLPGLDN